MPTAAVYLAEAEWRTGDEAAADAAADVALEAAQRQGSNHILLQALADFPFVASRRIDTEPGGESAWHELGRALMAQRAGVAPPVRSTVELHEFGRSAIVVDGVAVRPRIAKTYELLSFLMTRPGLHADRTELLEALFDGRSDPSARAYLRQAIRWLREVLGTPDAVIAEDGDIRLGDIVTVAGESARLEVMLAEAARLQGAERLDATLAALAIADQGDFLPDASTQWVESRREALGSAITDARLTQPSSRSRPAAMTTPSGWRARCSTPRRTARRPGGCGCASPTLSAPATASSVPTTPASARSRSSARRPHGRRASCSSDCGASLPRSAWRRWKRTSAAPASSSCCARPAGGAARSPRGLPDPRRGD